MVLCVDVARLCVRSSTLGITGDDRKSMLVLKREWIITDNLTSGERIMCEEFY